MNISPFTTIHNNYEIQLINAIIYNDINYINDLINRETLDINKQDIHGNTALHYALYKGHESMDLLIEKGADLYIKNNVGISPINLL